MSEMCWCATCRPVVFGDMRMVLCPECGNKRCPRATDHRNACSGSNELGQAGSAYTAHLTPQRIINGAIMTQEEIEAIAQRPTCCKPFGEAVTLSRAERDALVAMARDGLELAKAAREALGFVSSAEQDYADGNLREAEDLLTLALVSFDAALTKEQA
ncbi:hypothetical protein [Achromobacter marplatensis]|uniref:hypothetical protein n=1 Tax=Achromobacter marplatensis TaxID=470868 RepID=UPI003C751F84